MRIMQVLPSAIGYDDYEYDSTDYIKDSKFYNVSTEDKLINAKLDVIANDRYEDIKYYIGAVNRNEDSDYFDAGNPPQEPRFSISEFKNADKNVQKIINKYEKDLKNWEKESEKIRKINEEMKNWAINGVKPSSDFVNYLWDFIGYEKIQNDDLTCRVYFFEVN